GVTAVHHILFHLKEFTDSIQVPAANTPYKQELEEMIKMLNVAELQPAFQIKPTNKLSFQDTAALDKLLRFQQIDKVKKLLYYIYNLDVYISVANVATARNFVFPEAVETSQHTIRI